MTWQRKKRNRRRALPVEKARQSMRRLPTLGPRRRGWLLLSVMVMVLSASVWQVKDWLGTMDKLVLKQVRVGGSFVHISREKVESLLAPYAGLNFFDVNVADIKQVLELQPWVRQASVRRQWPDSLEITISEQHAVARWGDRGLLNEHASAFFPAGGLPLDLPSFDGVEHSEHLMLAQWQQMTVLLQPLGLKIVAMRLDERRSWRISLDNGLKLMLGRAQDLRRIQRFVAFYPRLLAARAAEVDVVDLRYPNGIVLRWRTAQKTVAQVG